MDPELGSAIAASTMRLTVGHDTPCTVCVSVAPDAYKVSIEVDPTSSTGVTLAPATSLPTNYALFSSATNKVSTAHGVVATGICC